MWARGGRADRQHDGDEPYPGFKGKYFSMPVRNVVPKPLQKPHPPIWVACCRARDHPCRGAQLGIGALTFAFVDPAEAGKWAHEYYEIIKSDECVPIGHTVNANVAMVTGFSCHEDARRGARRGAEGFQFFGYSLGHYYVYGHHQPGVTDVWQRFEAAKDKLPAGRAGQRHRHAGRAAPSICASYQDAGVDQVVFIQQGGRNKHEHICESLNLFAAKVMPALKADQAARDAKKQAELAPFIEAALKRKKRMAPVAPSAVPDGLGLRPHHRAGEPDRRGPDAPYRGRHHR